MRLLCLLFPLFLLPFLNAQTPLFPIVENGLQGFIDSTGKVIIPPKFKTIQPFSEGLAAAREPKGDYGFIDATGAWVIPPQYDYATEFSEGMAIVFKHGKPNYVNYKGEKPLNLPSDVLKITPFKNSVARVEVGKYLFYRNKIGLINKKGQWLLEPSFENIIYDNYNTIKIISCEYRKNKAYYSVGFIDTLGQWIVPIHDTIPSAIGQAAKVKI